MAASDDIKQDDVALSTSMMNSMDFLLPFIQTGHLLSFHYVKYFCRLSRFHYRIGLNKNKLFPALKMMLLREFDANMYEQHTKDQQHRIYASIRWMYGLFRNSNELTNDDFWNLEHNGNHIHSLNHTYYLMSHAPKLLFPIKYGFEKYLKPYLSISSMVWHFDFDETENIFEWMLKLLFAGNSPISLISDFYSFIMTKYGSANDAYFRLGEGRNMYLLLYNMMNNLIVYQPHHVGFWLEIVCIPKIKKWLPQNQINRATVVRFLDVIVLGLHDQTCLHCHDETNNTIILNANLWQPNVWMELLLSETTIQQLQFLGDAVNVKHVSSTRDQWHFLTEPCEEYRHILRGIFDVEYFSNFEKQRMDAMEIPLKLRETKYSFLYRRCNVLTKNSRQKMILFLTGKYMRSDIEHEDIVWNRTKLAMQSTTFTTKESIFRMLFKEKKWKKFSIKRR